MKVNTMPKDTHLPVVMTFDFAITTATGTTKTIRAYNLRCKRCSRRTERLIIARRFCSKDKVSEMSVQRKID